MFRYVAYFLKIDARPTIQPQPVPILGAKRCGEKCEERLKVTT